MSQADIEIWVDNVKDVIDNPDGLSLKDGGAPGHPASPEDQALSPAALLITPPTSTEWNNP